MDTRGRQWAPTTQARGAMRRLSADGRLTRRVCLVICLALAVSACAALPGTPPETAPEPVAGAPVRLQVVQQREHAPLRPNPWFATCNPCPEPTTKTPAGTVDEHPVNNDSQVSAPALGEEAREPNSPTDREPLHTVHFKFDSDDLETSDVANVRELLPDLEHRLVTVVGHTDAIGPKAYNENLAHRRARAVARLLVSLGIPAASVRVDGQGSCCYRASNESAAGRAENRRVEIFTTAPATSSPATPTSGFID